MNILKNKIILFIVFLPLLIVSGFIYIVNLLTIGSPVIHISYRTGLAGRPFKFYKFRTLKVTDKQYFEDPHGNEIHLNRYTNLLRRSKLDELPQILNLIKGDMALFGYRPLLHSQVDFIPLEVRKARSKVFPGLFGNSIISDKSQLERLQLDGEKANILIKLKLLLKTFSNFLYLEKNKATMKWDDFYLENRTKLFHENSSIIIDNEEIKIYSLEKKKITNREKINNKNILNLINSEKKYFKTLTFLLIYDLQSFDNNLFQRFENRIFYFDRSANKLSYFISKDVYFPAKTFDQSFNQQDLNLVIMDLIEKKKLSINYPFKVEN